MDGLILFALISGIATRWKQAVAYHFTGDSVSGTLLKNLVTKIVEKANSIGLNVIAVTSDMGSSNRAMWREFGVMSSRSRTVSHVEHPCHPNDVLYFLADVPHIVKNLRAALVKHKTIILPPEICEEFSLSDPHVELSHIKDLIDFQSIDAPLAPKLTKKDIDPNHFKKMNVGSAMHVFSNSVSAGLKYMVTRADRPEKYFTTVGS